MVGQCSFSPAILYMGSIRIFVAVICESIDDSLSFKYLFVWSCSYWTMSDINSCTFVSIWNNGYGYGLYRSLYIQYSLLALPCEKELPIKLVSIGLDIIPYLSITISILY